MATLLLALTAWMVSAGCTPAPDSRESTPPGSIATDPDGAELPVRETISGESLTSGGTRANPANLNPDFNASTPGFSSSRDAREAPAVNRPGLVAGLPMVDPAANPAGVNESPSPQLRSDLTPGQLSSFLGEVDREMRSLINGQSGITDPRAIQSEVERVVELKRTASQRLMDDASATDEEKVLGRRGYLQAMSHLASMGDLPSAEQLQRFAEQFRDDPHPELRSDSRLVLIGFAIESLRHGKQDAAGQVLQLMRDVAASDQPVDVATLMVMGQAKDTLLQYEHIDEATEIRGLIIDRFASSGDSEVAKMAAMIAASGFAELPPELQRLENLRAAIVDPREGQPPVTSQQWGDAVDAVLNDSVDLLTIQFLAGMSLESEAIGRGDIADATYDRLQRNVVDRQDAIGREARTAIEAKRNRENVIGQRIDPNLPSVTGQPLSLDDYRGRVVLMPFWSGAFPDSLAVLPNLLEIQSAYPNDVSVVGMNLDLAGTDVQGFMNQNGLDFRSFRSESDPSADVANEVAYRFGAVSLQFVAILDQAGKVVSVEFSGEDLTEKVENLLR